MESSLTELEMDAVLQLIQLSGSLSQDFQVFLVNFPSRGREEIGEQQEEEKKEESVGEASSSPEKTTSEEALPRRREKLRPIIDIYRETRALIKNRRPYKRSKI